MTHLDHLIEQIPDLKERRILDIGSGRGGFLVEAVRRGFEAQGLEINPKSIERAHERAKTQGVTVAIKRAGAEDIPFPNASFEFANVGEVLEHVVDPDRVLAEVARVLTPNGKAYVSIPNRMGFFDPHYHVYLVNWLPRAWSDSYLGFLGRLKNYEGSPSGRQRLSEMHYRTLKEFKAMCYRQGLLYKDSREQKVATWPFGRTLLSAYRLYAFFFLSTFHGIVTKRPSRSADSSTDALLAGDIAYVASETATAYLAYPSREVPRFLIPADDITAQSFILRMLLADHPAARALLRIPGVVRVVTGIFFHKI